MRVAEAIELDAKTERALRTLSKGRRVEARVQQRASVILLAAQGWQNKDIATEVKLDRPSGLDAGCRALGPHTERGHRARVAHREHDLV